MLAVTGLRGAVRVTKDGTVKADLAGGMAGHAAAYHVGDNPGYLSFAAWIPDLAASVVVLLNDSAGSVTGLVRQLLPAVLAS